MSKTGALLLLFIGFIFFGCSKKEVPPVVQQPQIIPKEDRTKSEPEKPLPSEEKKPNLEEFLKATEKKDDKGLDLETIKLYGRGTAPLLAIFFDFDDFTIRSDMWDRIRANVKYLLERREIKVVLEGNCDERGTNEYNLTLGMKRALEVKRALVKLGVDETRIEVVSFGEERPVCHEKEESCYSLNRRVDFIIKK